MKTVEPSRIVSIAVLMAFCVFAQKAFSQGGSLTPTGAPEPTMKTLTLIDPGTPIRQSDLPRTISTPGSYYLAENLSRDPSLGAAITVSSANVTIDMRGFTIEASGGSGASASQSAVYISTSVADNITIKNGNIAGPWYGGVYASSTSSENMKCLDLTVDGAVNTGLKLGLNARVTGCTVDGGSSTTTGISVDDNSVLRDCVVHHCTGAGFDVDLGCVVAHCVSAQNQGDGFDIASDSVVNHCSSYDNTLAGFDLGAGINISHSTAALNEDDGFNASTASIISECIARNNGQGSSNTNADGFQFNSRAILKGSFADNNEGIGINDGSGGTATIRDNAVIFNTSGGIDISLSGALVTGNHALFNGNYQYDLSGTDIGPIENASNGTSPNANFD